MDQSQSKEIGKYSYFKLLVDISVTRAYLLGQIKLTKVDGPMDWRLDKQRSGQTNHVPSQRQKIVR